jgi:hypothetical protein
MCICGTPAYRPEEVQFTEQQLKNRGKRHIGQFAKNQKCMGVPHLKFCSIFLRLILSRLPRFK